MPARAIVIGTGAGGAVAAATLAAEWGDGVVILEAGRHLKASDLTQRGRDLLPILYAGGGTQGTEDGSIALVQGRAVGGSTLVNDALCFRPPPELAERWRAYGVDVSDLAPFADEIEARLSVTQIPKEMTSKANYLIGLGAARLGWAGERLRHNSVGCVMCGFRHLGCAYDAKQSMNLTYVPDAIAAGAVLHPETEAHHLTRSGGGWVVHTTDGRAFEAPIVVVCAGVVQTPTLLLRSGFDAGTGLQVHLQAVSWGDHDEPVDGHNGIPMSYGVLEHADVYGHRGPGYLIEGCTWLPEAFGAYVPLQGEAFDEALRRYRFLAGAVMLLRSTSRGRVTLGPGGRAKIDLPLDDNDRARTAGFYQQVTALHLASGARRVLVGHRSAGWVTAPPTGLDVEPGRQLLYSAHLFGGANRGTHTDAVGRVPGQPGLWVLDGSAVPEAVGVNPQVTIAALALQGARRILAG